MVMRTVRVVLIPRRPHLRWSIDDYLAQVASSDSLRLALRFYTALMGARFWSKMMAGVVLYRSVMKHVATTSLSRDIIFQFWCAGKLLQYWHSLERAAWFVHPQTKLRVSVPSIGAV